MRTLAIAAAVTVLFAPSCGGDTPYYYAASTGDIASARDTDAGEVSVDDTSTSDIPSDITRVELPGDALADPGELSSDQPLDSIPSREAFGGVVIFEVRSPGLSDLETGGVGAGFRSERASSPEPLAVVGTCSVFPSGSASELFQAGASLDAGPITITTGAETLALTIQPSAEGPTYVSDADPEQIEFFEGGQTITASSPGGAEANGFELSVVAPEPPEILEPTWSFGDEHDRGDPLTVRWSGSGGTSLVLNLLPVEVFPTPGIADGNSVTCTADDTGTFTIPSEVLAYLPEGDLFGGGTVALTVVRSVTSAHVFAGTEASVTATASQTVVGGVP